MKLYTLFILALLSTVTYSQIKVEGYVHDELTGKPLCGTQITLSILDSIAYDPRRLDSFTLIYNNYDSRYDTAYTKFRTIPTDSDGHYCFENVPISIYELTIFHITGKIRPDAYEGEYDRKAGIKVNEDCFVTNSFILHITCEYDKTKYLKHCPKCNRSNRVLPIVWGLMVDFEHADPHYYYNGFCMVPRCHPTKHCTRCNLDF